MITPKKYITSCWKQIPDTSKKPNWQIPKTIIENTTQCNLIINKKQIKHLMQKKPQPPTLKAQLKLHKPGNPIRPVVNNMSASLYIIAKHINKKLNAYLWLNNYYNVKNYISLAEDLTKLKTQTNYKMMTYDIKDLYINTPIEETLMITKSLLLKHNDAQVTKQIITLLEVILQQNYCSLENILYQPKKGVSMGSPVSNTIAEIFLQYIEDTYLKQLLDKKT